MEITQSSLKGKNTTTATKEISKKYTKKGVDGGMVAYEYLKVVKGWNTHNK